MSDAFCRTAFTCWPDWRGRDLRFPSTPEKGQCAGLPYPPRLWQLQHETPVPPEKAQTQGRDKDRISKGFANLHRQPHGVFSDAHEMTLTTAQGSRVVSFASAIIAAGSRVFKLPGLPWDDPRVMDSTDALEMQDVPECLLAIEMGCEAGDIGLSIHPHPTLSETIAMSAEVFEGTITDLYISKRG